MPLTFAAVSGRERAAARTARSRVRFVDRSVRAGNRPTKCPYIDGFVDVLAAGAHRPTKCTTAPQRSRPPDGLPLRRMALLRRLVAPAAVLLALAGSAPALAQTPGDDQYADPFGGSNGSNDSNGSSGGGGNSGSLGGSGTSAPAPTATPSPSAPAPAAPATPSASSTATPATTATAPAAPAAAAATASTTTEHELPYTGADAGLVALAGVLCLGGGVALRVRLRDPRA
jgi:hypothetical protein